MKITNGKIIITIGIIHTAATMLPSVYGRQFLNFAGQYFFKIDEGALSSAPLNFETFAAFWCFYFGLFLFPLGLLVDYFDKNRIKIPGQFIWSYFTVIAIGVYMIPASGMTVFLLPHAIYMLVKNRKGE